MEPKLDFAGTRGRILVKIIQDWTAGRYEKLGLSRCPTRFMVNGASIYQSSQSSCSSQFSSGFSTPQIADEGDYDPLSYSPTAFVRLPQNTKPNEDGQAQLELLHNDDVRNYEQELVREPPVTPCSYCDAASQPLNSSPTLDWRNGPRKFPKRAMDDSIVRGQPSQNVDYLSHDWKEQDIWLTWKHIASEGHMYGDSTRLENAAWRAWTKSKYRLKTVTPEALHW